MRSLFFSTTAFVVAATVIAGNVHAQDSTEVPEAQPTAPEVSPLPPLPGGLAPGRVAKTVYVVGEAGWDASRKSSVFDTQIEAPIFAGLSLRAGATSNPADARVSPSMFLKLDVLSQQSHGVAASVFGGYRGDGFNLVPALEVGITLGGRRERLGFATSFAYGQGLQRGERYGDVRATTLFQLNRRVFVGADARGRFDLEWDSDEPDGEAMMDGLGGGLAVVKLGPVFVTGQAGVSVLSLRAGGPVQVGPAGRLGFGAAF